MATYDAIAEEYRKSKLAPWRQHLECHTMFELLGNLAGLRVLDLACGEGFYSRQFKACGAAAVVAVDISSKMIELAEKQEAANPLGIRYLAADAMDLDLGETFDIVVPGYLLNYARTESQLHAMARTIARHLRPGGRMVAVNNNPMQALLQYDSTRPYGFIKAAPQGLAAGAPVTYTIYQDGTSFSFDNYYLPGETHEEAFTAAGLSQVRWQSPRLSDEGRNQFAVGYWDAFLANPPVIFIEARRSA